MASPSAAIHDRPLTEWARSRGTTLPTSIRSVDDRGRRRSRPELSHPVEPATARKISTGRNRCLDETSQIIPTAVLRSERTRISIGKPHETCLASACPGCLSTALRPANKCFRFAPAERPLRHPTHRSGNRSKLPVRRRIRGCWVDGGDCGGCVAVGNRRVSRPPHRFGPCGNPRGRRHSLLESRRGADGYSVVRESMPD